MQVTARRAEIDKAYLVPFHPENIAGMRVAMKLSIEKDHPQHCIGIALREPGIPCRISCRVPRRGFSDQGFLHIDRHACEFPMDLGGLHPKHLQITANPFTGACFCRQVHLPR